MPSMVKIGSGETKCAEKIYEYYTKLSYFKENPEYVLLQMTENDEIERHNVLAMVRGTTTASSIMKFYKSMNEHGHISNDEYKNLCDIIKNNMEIWQLDCDECNNIALIYPKFLGDVNSNVIESEISIEINYGQVNIKILKVDLEMDKRELVDRFEA